jgi:hypothetical protein
MNVGASRASRECDQNPEEIALWGAGGGNGDKGGAETLILLLRKRRAIEERAAGFNKMKADVSIGSRHDLSSPTYPL